MPNAAQANGVARQRARDIGPCRVEHRREDSPPVVLSHLDHCFGHHAELAPYDAHLRLSGRAHGEVVLIDEKTDEVIARRRLERPARSRPRSATRPRVAPKTRLVDT